MSRLKRKPTCLLEITNEWANDNWDNNEAYSYNDFGAFLRDVVEAILEVTIPKVQTVVRTEYTKDPDDQVKFARLGAERDTWRDAFRVLVEQRVPF